ncbi:MAG: hypothetical protein HQ528_06880, partial [Candidatus Marinimicrobia bacterium]|nr:hypothetical protein [Candidatus Neomarinimicrobiota bacterium]
MKMKSILFTATIALFLLVNFTNAQTPAGDIPDDEKLVILWTSGDRAVALKMVFMYAGNAPRFEWWQHIT